MALELREHSPGGDVAAFLDLPNRLYNGDPGWVPPLRGEAKKQLDPRKNPFFEQAEVALFTAWRGGEPVGRCSAQVDREHLRVHGDQTGFFGFFDTADDAEAGAALLDTAAAWCAERGMRRLRGPFSLCINEEIGIMVEGFDRPSMMLTPYHRPYQGEVVEAGGLRPSKDVLTWQHDIDALPERALRAYREISAMEEVRLRPVDKHRLTEEMQIVRAIFNEAWQDNWSFVPWTEAQFKKMVKDFKFILKENIALIAEIDGEPAAICICLPNLNDWIRDLDGRLGPIKLAKLLWRSKRGRPSSAKLPLMGMKPAVQRKRRYAGIPTALCVELHRQLLPLGTGRVELGWTLEDNHLINATITRVGGYPVKRHRIYERALA